MLPDWAEVAARYDVVEEDVRVESTSGDILIRLARVRDINALVDAMGPDDFGPDERLPYWAALWPSAVALARAVLAQGSLEGPVLELGAGLGLGSIAAALRGAQVTATDYEPDALAFLLHNAALNGVSIEARQWDWRDPVLQGSFQTILGADLLYEARNVTPVVAAIASHLGPGGLAIVTDPRRPHWPAFAEALRADDFVLETRQTDDIAVMCARRTTPGSAATI